MQSFSRDEIRELQNEIINKCEKIGYPDNIIISENMPKTITLGTLRSFIFPEYINELTEILAILNRRCGIY